MSSLFGETVFTVGRQLYYWEDVVLAGLIRGEWALFERDLRYGLACLARARAENVLPSKQELQASAAAFRYERDLISAEEASGWLARWKVRPEDWMDYLRRAVLRSRWCANTEMIAERFPQAEAEVDAARHAEAVCSGTLARLARKLAERAACTDALSHDTAIDHDAFADGDALIAAAEGLGIPRARSRQRLDVVRRVERSYLEFRRRVLTACAISREIRTHQLDLTRVACDSIAFESEGAALEALLCLRADRQSVRDVAMAAHRTSTAQRLYFDQLPSTIGDRLAGARQGEVFGPIVFDGKFVVLQVNGKILPAEDDPEIISRAESSLFSRVVQRDLMPVIQWQSAL